MKEREEGLSGDTERKLMPRLSCWHLDLGLVAFTRAHRLQLEILESRIANHIHRDVVFVMEHPSVFTVGRRGSIDNLKVPRSFLDDSGIEIHHIERGGDITFHGPGQLVVYPIIHLKKSGLGVLSFVEKLEEAMIRTAEDWGIPAVRDPRNRGVWVKNRKMGSIGISVRRGVTFHGLALNVDLPLEPFSWINPCGLQDIDVTAMNRATNRSISMEDVKTAMKSHMESIFSFSFQAIELDNLKDMIK